MSAASVKRFSDSLLPMKKEEIIRIAVGLFEKNENLTAKLTENQNANTEMALQFQQMKDELKGAKEELEILRKQNQHLTGVNVIRAKDLYGRSTEKTKDIFDMASEEKKDADPLDEDASQEDVPEEPEKKEEEPSGEKTPEGEKGDGKNRNGEKKKRKKKRSKDLSGLPECRIFDYDIQKLNEQFGEGNWRFSFWHAHVTVEVVKRTTYKKVVYTPAISVGLEHCLVTMPYEHVLFQKSIASPSLLATIMTDKYGMYLPAYRQEHDPLRFGIPISRQTMCNWMIRASREFFLPVYQEFCRLIASCPYQQCDETTYTVIHDGRRAGSKSYIWVHRTSELLDFHEVVAYCYERTRSEEHLRNFYQGQKEHFYLTCDAYAAYPAFEEERGGMVTVCGCYMHARRRFADALAVLETSRMTESDIRELPEAKGLSLINEIYLEDEPLKELPVEERQEKRKTDVRKKVDAYFEFIHAFDMEDPLASEKLKDAIQYSRNQEKQLRRFLEDGNIPIDDGATERNVKPIALGRRNYLFSNTENGAKATVIITTLIETAKANQADAYYYLKYLLEKMPYHIRKESTGYLSDMMPWSEAYRKYETDQKQMLAGIQAPPGNHKPKTPRKRDRLRDSA